MVIVTLLPAASRKSYDIEHQNTINRYVRPSVLPSVRPHIVRISVRLSVCMFVCPVVRQSAACPSARLSLNLCRPAFVFDQFLCLSVCLSVHPSFCIPSVSICMSVCLSVHFSSICTFVCMLVHLFIRLSVCGAEPVGVFLPVCVPAYSAYVCLCLRSDWLWSSYCTTSYVLLRFFYLYFCLYDFVFVLESASLCACVSMYVSIRSNVCPYCREKLFSC